MGSFRTILSSSIVNTTSPAAQLPPINSGNNFTSSQYPGELFRRLLTPIIQPHDSDMKKQKQRLIPLSLSFCDPTVFARGLPLLGLLPKPRFTVPLPNTSVFTRIRDATFCFYLTRLHQSLPFGNLWLLSIVLGFGLRSTQCPGNFQLAMSQGIISILRFHLISP